MTNWFDSTSLKNTSCPVSGHLIQRFSGDSRRFRKLRIFGRTTFEIQFMIIVLPGQEIVRRAPASTGAGVLLVGTLADHAHPMANSPIFILVVGCRRMQQATVVPDDEVLGPPLVRIDILGPGCPCIECPKKSRKLGFAHAEGFRGAFGA